MLTRGDRKREGSRYLQWHQVMDSHVFPIASGIAEHSDLAYFNGISTLPVDPWVLGEVTKATHLNAVIP